MLISGIMQILGGLFATLMGLSACAGSYGLCCFCPLIGIIPVGIGVWELTIASQMQAGKPVANAPQVNLASLVVAVMMLSGIPVVLEVLAMVNLGKPEVKDYLARNALPLEE